MSSRIQILDQLLLDEVTKRALVSPRRRTNHNFHASAEDNPHRFLNALTLGTYCQPHRHVTPPKSESFLVLRGSVAVFVFDDAGKVIETQVLTPNGTLAVDIPGGVWHAIACVSETAVCYEVKAGPYIPSTEKDFAPWAPKEGEPRAQSYLEQLLAKLA